MFTDSYLPRVSGVVHSLEALVRALRHGGHDVLVVAPAYPGYQDSDRYVLRFPSFRPLRAENFPLAMPVSRAVTRRLDEFPLDVIHTHTPFLLGSAAGTQARRRGVPLAFTHHTFYEEYVHYATWVPPGLSRAMVRTYVTWYANHAACTIAPSRAAAAYLRVRGVTSRLEVIPTGTIETAQFAELTPAWVRPAFGLQHDQPLLVTASRLGKEKSVDLLLAAFARLPERFEAALLVVGGGPQLHELQALAAQLGVARRAIFAGLLSHRQAVECMAAADVFLFASQTETQGLAVIEAMAAGVPVVAVDAGGVADAVEDGTTGFLTPPAADALAARTAVLLEDPRLRRQFGDAGRAAAEKFSLEHVTAQVVGVYESLLAVGRH
ncbi:MAG TPA: glycosyltransferase [bacterium]|jgi:glycosyltransferase involved in cell wall biosynthesis